MTEIHVPAIGEEEMPPEITYAFLTEVANHEYNSVEAKFAVPMAQELLELREKVERLSAPITEKEWYGRYTHITMRCLETVNAILESRKAK